MGGLDGAICANRFADSKLQTLVLCLWGAKNLRIAGLRRFARVDSRKLRRFLQLELYCLQLSFFAYSPFRCLSESDREIHAPPPQIDDQHRECQTGGGAYFAFLLSERAKGAAKAPCGETVIQKGVFGESVSSLPAEGLPLKHLKGPENLKEAEKKRTLQKHPFGRPFLRTAPSPLLWRVPILGSDSSHTTPKNRKRAEYGFGVYGFKHRAQ